MYTRSSATWTTATLQSQTNYLYLGNKPLNHADDRVGSNRSAGGYFPFGQGYSATNPGAEGQTFGTYVQDTGTGLAYADQRYYDQSWGRFVTADPSDNNIGLGNPITWNRYSYGNGDPTNSSDPSGLDVACGVGMTWDGEGCMIGNSGITNSGPAPVSLSGGAGVSGGPGGTGGSGGSSVGSLSADLTEAYGNYVGIMDAVLGIQSGLPYALQALAQPSCAALFGTSSPITILSTYVQDTYSQAGDSGTYAPTGPGDRSNTVVTNINTDDGAYAGTLAGENGSTIIHELLHAAVDLNIAVTSAWTQDDQSDQAQNSNQNLIVTNCNLGSLVP